MRLGLREGRGERGYPNRMIILSQTYGHLEKCLCEIKVALLLYSGLMIFGLRSSLSV